MVIHKSDDRGKKRGEVVTKGGNGEGYCGRNGRSDDDGSDAGR